MIRLVISTNDEQITVQDPNQSSATSESTSVINVDANTTKNVDMTWGQLERIRPQLDALEASGLCTFTVDSTGGSAYAEQADNAGNPVIDSLDDVSIAGAGDTIAITGSNLLGGGAFATASVEGDTVAGSVLVQAVTPGNDGNLIDIVVVDTGGGGLAVAVAVVSGRTVITVDLGGSVAETCTTVAAAIDALASVEAAVVGVGGTGITAAQTLEALTGGSGAGMSLTIAGSPCTITDVDDSADPIIVVSATTPVIAVGIAANLQLRSNGKVSNITVPTV